MKRKILIIRYEPLKYFIHSIPAFAAIRKFHKNDEVYILTENSLVKFCKRSGFFDKVWLDNKPEWFQPMGMVDLIKRLKGAKFDMVYDLQNSKRTAWYFKLMGFKKPQWNTSVVNWASHYYPIESDNMSYQELLAKQLKVAGIKSMPMVNISPMANEEADLLPQRYAMICAAGDVRKSAFRWHPSKYGELMDYLYEKHGLVSVLVGDDYDDRNYNSLVANQCIKTRPIDFSGLTDINGIIAVAKKAVFCIGNDTAPAHIAAFSGCKTIIFCSEFSPSELAMPKVRNIAVIEEPSLENVELERAVRAIEEFGLKNDEDVKHFRTISDIKLEQISEDANNIA